jgi:hypothetical protein
LSRRGHSKVLLQYFEEDQLSSPLGCHLLWPHPAFRGFHLARGWQVGAELVRLLMCDAPTYCDLISVTSRATYPGWKFETLQSEIGLGVGLPTKGVESQPKQHGGGKGSWGVSLLGLTMFNEAEALAR